METKYFVDVDGNLIGTFVGDTGVVPLDAIEVPSLPADGRSKWDGTQWLPPVLTVEEKAKNLGVTDATKVAAMWEFLANEDKTAIDNLKLKIAEANL